MILDLKKAFIFLLFYLAPIVDAFTGYLILSDILPEGSAGSPSQALRLFLIVLMASILKNCRVYLFGIAVFLSYIVLIELYFTLFHQNYYGIAIGLIYGSKIGYLIMIFYTLLLLIKNGSLSPISLLLHVRNYIAITAAFIIFSLITGTGFNTYAEGTFGVKGFFSAGNGLGVFMGIGALLSIYYWHISRERFSLTLSFIILFGTLIIGSKTALLLGSIGLLSTVKYTSSKPLTLLIISFGLIAITLNVDRFIELISLVYDVILFRYNNSDSIFSWVFSNRDNYFIDAITTVSYDGALILRFFIGFGAYISFRDPTNYHPSIDVLETDLGDLFFMYGISITLAYLAFIVWGIYKGINRKRYFLTLSFLLLMTHSFMAGHVIFNGMSGTLVPIILLLILTPPIKHEKNSIYTPF